MEVAFPDRCIGCGICVRRCPIGAIHLDPESGVATIAPPVGNRPVAVEKFRKLRDCFASELPEEIPEQVESAELSWIDEVLSSFTGSGALTPKEIRLLVRNYLVVLDGVASLATTGDNSAWAELVAMAKMEHEQVFVFEIDINASPDACRRILAGLAISGNRYSMDLQVFTPIVVMLAQPNRRSEYYTIVADVARYLGIKIKTLPISAIVLASRKKADLLSNLQSGGYVDSLHMSNCEWLSSFLGPGSEKLSGTRPAK
ncbi:MAG: 4Fe-4S binding protein [Cellulomonadaceae bacterium]|nr:4Fe-4S binding protein [Cellulomonadaceae bacterium]